ncbi:aminoglycoside phosphotransferase family protein [Arthrobacter sp. YA7-1]|uniref:aminoglycoside phosphotransferase family protein n=1 Tax=Arthrobacter sp. YA7-1 TaxID=2987701 RepID=UPI0022276708|nr:aminoglycoside phosphotransferase family protein [Arthrobacter sp. YA7-1]UYY80073.1 aminoglycoside phosphotransferase family protein [Arthrobacter sp. YA7-1]
MDTDARPYVECGQPEPAVPLLGGDVTEGLVRVGDTVRRPASDASPRVRRVLDFLQSAGFQGAPRFLGIDEDGRDTLSFVPGEAAGRPWPRRVADESSAISVARLVRAYDDAVQPLGVPDWAYAHDGADPLGCPGSIAGPATFLAHMDITPENVVFRDGTAVALIDFDLLRPATRAEEVANLLLWWGAWMPVTDRDPVMRGVDAASRAAVLVDAYGLGPADRAKVVHVARNAADRSWHLMRHRALTKGGGWKRMWDEGVGDKILRRQAWLAENAAALHAAITSR